MCGPLDGGHAEHAAGVASAAEVEVASGNKVEDAEKDAIDAAREEVMEGDEAGAGAGRCRGHAGRTLQRGRGCVSLSRVMWRSLRLAL